MSSEPSGERPDPRDVIMEAFHDWRTSEPLGPVDIDENILAALRAAGFHLVHDSDRERLIEAAYQRLWHEGKIGDTFTKEGVRWDVITTPRVSLSLAVAAMLDALRAQSTS